MLFELSAKMFRITVATFLSNLIDTFESVRFVVEMERKLTLLVVISLQLRNVIILTGFIFI